MRLYYEGTDITDDVRIAGAVHRDTAGGRCDSLELTLERADDWYRWGPQRDDEIRIVHDGYDTGRLYLNTVLPENNKYRILATGMKSAARRQANAAYMNVTLSTLFSVCAAECGMEAELYGFDGDLDYPFVLRQNEGCAAFLHRLMQWEGGVLKTFDGRFVGISCAYAQSLPAAQTLKISAQQAGFAYRRREDAEYCGLKIETPYAEAAAIDADTAGDNAPVINHLPALSAAQAGRWARGLLLTHNRQAEEASVQSVFNRGLTAMARVDVESSTPAAGEWLVEEVTHDFVRKSSAARMLRCRNGIR